jgi:hypothetical protein
LGLGGDKLRKRKIIKIQGMRGTIQEPKGPTKAESVRRSKPMAV